MARNSYGMVSAKVKPFGMKHIAYDPYTTQEAVADVNVKLLDMNTVLAESDFLNISCPLNEKTRHLIGKKELSEMKKTSALRSSTKRFMSASPYFLVVKLN